MAQHVQRVRIVGVARRHDLDLLAVLEREPQVLHASVRAQEHGLLGELADRSRRRVEALAPSGSSSSDASGRTTFMAEEDTEHPREDDRNEPVDGSPVPDPEEEQGTARDDPQAD